MDAVVCTLAVCADTKGRGTGNWNNGRTTMSGYTKKNLRKVENQAPKFGMPAELEARFARTALGGESLGLSLFRLEPGFRIPFGHKHVGQEEVYVIVQGSGRIKVEDEIVAVGQWDAIRFDKDTMRDVEAGPDGIEYVAFGAGDDPAEVEMAQNWWDD
jgi:mannose-6-phosphate isomerase-like protein (cupin superfamily)